MCEWKPNGASDSPNSATSATVGSCMWMKPVFDAHTFVIISLMVVVLSGPIYAVVSVANKILMAPTPSDIEQSKNDLAAKRVSADRHHAAAHKSRAKGATLIRESQENPAAAELGEASPSDAVEAEGVHFFSRHTRVNDQLLEQFQRAQSFKTSVKQVGLTLVKDRQVDAERRNHFCYCSNLMAEITDHDQSLQRGREQVNIICHLVSGFVVCLRIQV